MFLLFISVTNIPFLSVVVLKMASGSINVTSRLFSNVFPYFNCSLIAKYGIISIVIIELFVTYRSFLIIYKPTSELTNT